MVRIAVRVVPRSSRNAINREGTGLKVHVTAPPVDGAANEALIALLAEHLKLPRRALHIVQGATSRQKMVEIEGLTSEEVAQRLISPEL
jgi:uncharacterized protein